MSRMANFELTNTLLATQNPDGNIRKQAEGYLKEMEQNDFTNYLNLLCDELSNENKPTQSVLLAGILLKNAVDAKNTELKKSLQARWIKIPAENRATIREKVLGMLNSKNQTSRSVSALVVSKIASVEMPFDNWPNLVQNLIKMASAPISANNSEQENAISANASEGAFKTIGYLCEEVPDHMEKHANAIFELSVEALRSKLPPFVKSLVLQMIYQALFFSQDVLSNDRGRVVVTNAVFECLRGEDENMSVAAFEFFTRFSEVHYRFLSESISDVLKETARVLRNSSTPQSVVLRALDFWATLSEYETELQAPVEAVFTRKEDSKNYIARSLPGVVPLLLEQMTRQTEENFEEDAVNGASASSACLQLVSRCAKDELAPLLVPFLRSHLRSNDWRQAEAAVCAVGVLMEGPGKETLAPIVSDCYNVILSFCASDNAFLRDTATWTLARICKTFGAQMVNSDRLALLLQTAIKGLKDRPKIAANCCWCLHSIASATAENQPSLGANALTPFFQNLVQALLETSKRPDSGEHQLLFCCYETVNQIVLSAAEQSKNDVLKLAALFTADLKRSLSASVDHAIQISNLQAVLVGSISSVIKVMAEDDVLERVDDIMKVLFVVLNSRDKTIFEEVLLAIGAVITKIKSKMSHFVSELKPFLMSGLGNSLGPDACQVSIGVVGDVFRAMGNALYQNKMADDFVQALIKTLQNPSVERRVKPSVIVCFGDIALSLNENFGRYFSHVMSLLERVAKMQLAGNSYADIEFSNSLRSALFETFSMILHSVRAIEPKQKFFQFIAPIVDLVDKVVNDDEKSPEVVSSALALIGDMADILKETLAPLSANQSIRKLFEIGNSAQNESVKQSLKWALIASNNMSFKS